MTDLAKTPAKKTAEISPSQRFTEAVMREYKNNIGEVEITHFQKKLINNYFIKLDSVLKDAEIKRASNSGQYAESVPVVWANINMNKLAFDVVGFSSVGLDPLQPNHINLIPYKIKHTGVYDITGILGYRGTEMKSKKFGLNFPDDVVVELVYSTDKFKIHKKDRNNKVEGYDFSVTNEMKRGEIVGGFYYHEFHETPWKNKVVFFTVAEIEKRKPKYASPEFWGGQKDVYKNGSKTGEKETVEGWRTEMLRKTVYKAAYNDVTIDSQKIESFIAAVLDQERSDSHFVATELKDLDDNFDSFEIVGEKKKALREKKAAETPTGDAPKTDATGQVNMM
jgi:recombination protein RecT